MNIYLVIYVVAAIVTFLFYVIGYPKFFELLGVEELSTSSRIEIFFLSLILGAMWPILFVIAVPYFLLHGACWSIDKLQSR